MTDYPLLDVLAGREPARRPVWLMRQAGRYLPEYRAVRAEAGSFLALCYDPERAAEVTLQPLRRFDIDAAILFSDILVVPHAMGLELDFVEGEGPRLETVRDLVSVEALSGRDDGGRFARVYETVERVKAGLPAGVGFIGFCGGPWTVASYMIEGGSSRRENAVRIAVENPAWFERLIERLVEVSVQYLLGQIRAGVDAVQIFDSWAGDIPTEARARVVTGPISRIVSGVRKVYPGFPVIVFARGVAGGHVEVASATGASVIGVEQGVRLAELVEQLPGDVAVQGNLGPELLLAESDVLRRAARDVLQGVPKRRHIFNLGHGITPDVKPEAVEEMVRAVRAFDRG